MGDALFIEKSSPMGNKTTNVSKGGNESLGGTPVYSTMEKSGGGPSSGGSVPPIPGPQEVPGGPK